MSFYNKLRKKRRLEEMEKAGEEAKNLAGNLASGTAKSATDNPVVDQQIVQTREYTEPAMYIDNIAIEQTTAQDMRVLKLGNLVGVRYVPAVDQKELAKLQNAKQPVPTRMIITEQPVCRLICTPFFLTQLRDALNIHIDKYEAHMKKMLEEKGALLMEQLKKEGKIAPDQEASLPSPKGEA